MAQCMNALAGKVHIKKCHAHSDARALHNMATLLNNHPYISSSCSSGTPVGTKFMATYVGMVVGTSCFCTLSASAFMH